VLVTGGAGFIGQRTAAALAVAGYEVRLMDSLAPPVHPNRVWPEGLRRNFDCLTADVRSRESWESALADVQAVVHLAAYQDYLPDFSNFLATNAAGTAMLYEVIVAESLPVERVVVASSQSVYGEGAHRCPEHGLQYPDSRSISQLQQGRWEIQCPVCSGDLSPDETGETTVNPQNPYGISKLSQELTAIHLGRRYGIPTVALRYSITQGAGQSFHNAYSGICRIFALCLLSRKPLPIYEDGGQLRDYVHVGDVVSANLMALRDERMLYRPFNVGGSQSLTVLEYARLMSEVAGVEAPLEMSNKYRLGDTRHIVSDSSRLESLGWKRVTELPQTIKEYLDWVRSQPIPEGVTERAQQRMRALGALAEAA
jgi:dTDP-L-rhamnose 4-epimerase